MLPDYETLLAISWFMGVCAIFLCGPFALLLHYTNFPLLSAFCGAAAIWLGIFWFAHTHTYFKWLGAASAACGLLVLWLTAKKL
jgi:hypothetical protein